MKHHALVLLSLLFLAAPMAALADAAPTNPEAPAVAEAPAACSDRAGLADPIRVGIISLSICTAAAECAPFQDVDCEGDSTCSVKDRNCFVGEPGFVTCDGNTTECAGACCATDGVCEVGYGCTCENDSTDCANHPLCVDCVCDQVTDCRFDRDCCTPGSICTPSGICLCAG